MTPGQFEVWDRNVAAGDKGDSRVSLADISATIGYDTTAAKMLGDGLFANCVSNGPMGKPLSEVSICVLVTWGGLVAIGKHAADDGDLGADLAYKDAIQQLWSLIGMAPKGVLDERYGIDRDGWYRGGERTLLHRSATNSTTANHGPVRSRES